MSSISNRPPFTRNMVYRDQPPRKPDTSAKDSIRQAAITNLDSERLSRRATDPAPEKEVVVDQPALIRASTAPPQPSQPSQQPKGAVFCVREIPLGTTREALNDLLAKEFPTIIHDETDVCLAP